MVKRSSKKRYKNTASANSSRGKGDIVEKIVASMHNSLNVKVERNVFLDSVRGGKRSREIDVLLSTNVVGYPIFIPIECKNEIKPVGVGKIDEFIGKLQDVGISTRLGVFVSTSGYTKGALTRANEEGIKTLVLRGDESIQKELIKAFQTIVYLLLNLSKIEIRNNIGGIAQTNEVLWFKDENGKICGSVPDLVWAEWQKGTLTEELGNHKIKLDLPSGWYQVINGQVAEVKEISAEITITGHLITIPGDTKQNELLNAASNRIEKWEIETTFNNPKMGLEVKTFKNNKELDAYLQNLNAEIKLVVGKLKIPRIIWASIYWPPSESALKKLHDLRSKALLQGKNFDFTNLQIGEIEGKDLSIAWEPIIQNYPATKLLLEMQDQKKD